MQSLIFSSPSSSTHFRFGIFHLLATEVVDNRTNHQSHATCNQIHDGRTGQKNEADPNSQQGDKIAARCLEGIFCITKFSAKNRRSEEHTSELQSRGHLVCRL